MKMFDIFRTPKIFDFLVFSCEEKLDQNPKKLHAIFGNLKIIDFQVNIEGI